MSILLLKKFEKELEELNSIKLGLNSVLFYIDNKDEKEFMKKLSKRIESIKKEIIMKLIKEK